MKFLDKNIWHRERIARTLLGSILLLLVLYNIAPIWIAVLALYPLATALVEWDPIYVVLHQVIDLFSKDKAVTPVKRPRPQFSA